MENATKALLIAGGVLIALIIITMFILMFNRLSSMEKEQTEQTEMEQLAAFNAEYEAFNKKVMYGVDVITLINKVEANNKKYLNNADYQIKILLNGIEINNSSSLIGTDQEKYLFNCKKIMYNDLGRISQIEIVNYN